jgi:UDP-N-acetylglucosamine:LPS N-acetylglucosamine transferase
MELNESLVKVLTEQKENLEKQLADCQREQNRLRYMASGYAALLAQKSDAQLIQRAKEIADEADKLN